MSFARKHFARRKLTLAAVTLMALLSPARSDTARAGTAFTPSATVATDSDPGATAVGDFNGDGAVTLLRNDGHASFTTDSSFSVGKNVPTLAAVDFTKQVDENRS